MQHLQPRPPQHPPVHPSIPLQSITSLIPRLTSTIRDIDTFQNLIAQGNIDGTLPDWDKLLERYNIILSRIQALHTSLAPPAPTSTTGTTPISHTANVSSATAAANLQRQRQVDLRNYLITPLNPLPHNAENGYMQQDLFFHSLNTLPLDQITQTNLHLLQGEGGGDQWKDKDSLRGLTDVQLARYRDELRLRSRREKDKGLALGREIEEGIGRYVWDMRIEEGEEGEGEDEEQEEVERVEAGGAKSTDIVIDVDKTGTDGNDEDDDEDLFGDDDEDEGDKLKAEQPQSNDKVTTSRSAAPTPPNPREGWTLNDYVRYMETGKKPLLPS